MKEEIKTIPARNMKEEDIARLPRWMQKNLDSAVLIGSSYKTIQLGDGRKYSLDNEINDLDSAEWIKNLCSVINTRYSTKGEDSFAHEIRKVHPTPKPPQLMRDLIKFFTKENDIVFDYFMGVGGSLLGAALCNRRGAGIDLNAKYVESYKKAATKLNLPVFPCLVGNSNEILDNNSKVCSLLNDEKASLILIDPPYANMMSKPKTGADIAVYGNVATPFTDFDSDLGNCSYHEFLIMLKNIVSKSINYLKSNGYLIIFCKDMQPKKKEPHLLHSDIVNALNEIPSLYFRGLKIWADQTVKLFPYGYPFDFVANQIHQYILIFRKY